MNPNKSTNELPPCIDQLLDELPGIDADQKEFMRRLVAGETLYSTSRAIGIPEETLRQWQSQPWFIEQSTKLQDHIAATACARARLGLLPIIDSLQEVARYGEFHHRAPAAKLLLHLAGVEVV